MRFTLNLACTRNSECQNGGTCVDGECTCSNKFGGSNCESKITQVIFGFSWYYVSTVYDSNITSSYFN